MGFRSFLNQAEPNLSGYYNLVIGDFYPLALRFAVEQQTQFLDVVNSCDTFQNRGDIREKNIPAQIPSTAFWTSAQRVQKSFQSLARALFDQSRFSRIERDDDRINIYRQIIWSGDINPVRGREVRRRVCFNVLANFFTQTERWLWARISALRDK